ncbi:hypothetical protein ACIP2X_35615 [Streptomyces sp. NPDC089424]
MGRRVRETPPVRRSGRTPGREPGGRGVQVGLWWPLVVSRRIVEEWSATR